MTRTSGAPGVLIGFVSDRPRVGKSLAAAYLRDQYGFHICSIGDSVKQELNLMLMSHGFKYAEEEKEDFRDGLIWWTEFRISRSSHDYWIRAALGNIPQDKRVLISDIRLPNEVDFVRSNGGKLIRINRKSSPLHQARVESALRSEKFEYDIDNSADDRGVGMFRSLDETMTDLRINRSSL